MIPLVLALTSVLSQHHVSLPPSHCLLDQHAIRFLHQVRHLLTSPDSSEAGRRETYGLKTERPDQVHLVTVDSVCVVASVAYAQDAGPAGDLRPPFRVAVAEGQHVYVVELATAAGREADYWEVVIYDRHWHRLASYGRGS